MKKLSLIFCILLSSCFLRKQTDMKNENLHPKIVMEKIKGHTEHLKNYQFTIDTIK